MRGKVFCLLICLLFATLQALYFRQIGLAPFPLLSFGILILLTSNVPNTKEDSNFLIIFYGIIFISIIVGVLNISYIPDSNYYFPRVLGWLLFPLSVIAFRKGYNQLDRQELFRAVSWVLAIHLFFFYLQNIVHTLNGQRLDFLVNITGEVQRTGATKLQEFKDSIRSSGLFSEPGSYCVYIYVLVCMKYIISRKVDISMLLGLTSMFLSFSMTGILMALFFLCYYLGSQKLSKRDIQRLIFVSIGLAIIIVWKSDVFLGPIQNRLLNLDEDQSAEARFTTGIEYFIDSGLLYSGVGIGNLSENISAVSVILSGLFDLGIILLAVFLFCQLRFIVKWSKSYSVALLLLPVFMSNISFNQIIYTAFFAFLTINAKEVQ